MVISFPSKTFLTGEYAVLHQAPAVLVNTWPRFEFHINKKAQRLQHPFHKESASGKWIQKNKKIFSNFEISLSDPYQNSGGFGRSSAEFNCVYYLSSQTKNVDLNKMLQTYKSLYELKPCPSGADILSQWQGRLCLINFKSFDVQSKKWPSWNLGFFIIKTRRHLPTWDHLKKIKGDFSKLQALADQAYKSMVDQKSEDWIKWVREYRLILDRYKLTSSFTKEILEHLEKNQDIMASKGCGAMGAESVVLFFNKDKKTSVHNFLKDNKYHIVAHDELISHGLNVEL